MLDATIDHFFPESLLEDDERRKETLGEYGLTDDFDINGFNNWLPCHGHCNQTKADRTLGYTPGLAFVLRKLINLAPKVKRTAREVSSDVTKDEVFRTLFTALERETITTEDLRQLFEKLVEEPTPRATSKDIILLEGGYWVYKQEVARQGECQCESNTCVDSTGKVYCYFPRDLSPWVIATGLYKKCYDEIVECWRCKAKHKRGHIGREGICGRPVRDQESQTDF